MKNAGRLSSHYLTGSSDNRSSESKNEIMKYDYTVLERFLKYVKIDTQSDAASNKTPSTEKQRNLTRLLAEELREMGVEDVEVDEWNYLYATLPSNTEKEVPTICFCSHVDTSPEMTGVNVKPQIHENYQGGKLSYPKNPELFLDPEKHPDLKNQIGNDIITTDGLTLLGADDKAGVAEIMDFVHFLQKHPDVKHGRIRILFTPDEEIGRGADKVDIKKLDAKYGYTVDGESAGGIEDETFSADGAEVVFRGINMHPGYAKNALSNAIKAAAAFVDSLPKNDWSPETTEGREGFVHPYEIQGGVDEVKIIFIVRSFEDEELKSFGKKLEDLALACAESLQGISAEVNISKQYRNMQNVLKNCPEVADYAVEAIERAGMKANKGSIRGGTDGSKLSFMGLSCPNLFAGGHSFHSKEEWIAVQDMHKAVDMLVELVQVWEEKS